MKKALLAIVFIGIAPRIQAQTTQRCDGKASYASCQIVDNDITTLCNFVSGKTPTPSSDQRFNFSAESWLWRMAGAHPDIDNDDVAKTKIQRMWQANRPAFTCNTSRMTGDLFSIAIRSNFPQFLELLHFNYDVDLSYAHPKDGTVLDFLASEIRRFEESGLGRSETAEALRGLYDTFRKEFRIKHAAELK